MTLARERTRRLFVALWPDDGVRQAIERECAPLLDRVGGRPIPAANLHVTLAFLGSTPESRLGSIAEVLRSIEFAPFELVLGEIKWWRRQELLSLEPTAGNDAVTALAVRFHAALRAHGFEIERRPFRTHMTLARSVQAKPSLLDIRAIHWRVDEVKLIESQTAQSGSVYTVLALQK